MAWCDDVSNRKFYNKITNLSKKVKSEKLFRKDYKYDYFIPIKYNYIKCKIENIQITELSYHFIFQQTLKKLIGLGNFPNHKRL